MTEPRDGLETLLLGAGFVLWPPADKPDLATVEALAIEDLAYLDDETPLRLQCANQCVRDLGHECGVEVDLGDVLVGSWVNKAAAQVPWMVLVWGPHMHQLPFCCTKCLIEFVDHRAVRSERRHTP